MKDDATYHIPTLTSAFPSQRHPAYMAIRSHNTRFVEDVLNPIARTKYDHARGDYTLTGADYACWIYPSGRVDRLKAFSNMSSAWAFIDDLADDSLDADYIDAILGAFARAVREQRAAGPEFQPIASLFAASGWAPGLHRLCTAEMITWIEAVRAIRAAEVAREPMSIEQYLDLRSRNDAINFLHPLAGYTMPELAEQVCAAARTDEYQQAVRHSGAAIGINLDLYMVNAKRVESTEWAHVVPVIQRSTSRGLDRQRAINAAVALFHLLEQQMADHLVVLEARYPAVADMMRICHAGNITWLAQARARGLRYAQA